MIEYLKEAARPSHETSDEVKRTVSQMLGEIERDGSDAIRRYSRALDGWSPPSFRVGPAEIAAASDSLPDELRDSIAFAQAQVRVFAERQRETLADLEVETVPGVTLGHRHVPVDAVGSYVPGGRYPMLASAFMTIVVPKVAGVGRVVAAAPPRGGEGIDPAMLHAIATSGADEIICLGGVQALAALAFGVDDVEPVDMIVGAGNAYVAEAKRQLFGMVGIDLLAGPTEILVIADETAAPELVAADLLGQAEHGPTSPSVLVTTSRPLAEQVGREVERLLETWPTAEVAGVAWRNYGVIAVAADRVAVASFANTWAAEHVEVQVDAAELSWYFDNLRNYGSLFLGGEATVAYGDKGIGTNHVLPTSRAARYTGGLWVGKFLKTLTHQRVTVEGTRLIAPAIVRICDAESMAGHALTVRMRLERDEAQSA